MCSLVNEMKSNPVPHPSVFLFSFLLSFSPHSSLTSISPFFYPSMLFTLILLSFHISFLPSILLPSLIYPSISPSFYPSPLIHLSFSPHPSILPFLPPSILLPSLTYPFLSPSFYTSPLIHPFFYTSPLIHIYFHFSFLLSYSPNLYIE